MCEDKFEELIEQWEDQREYLDDLGYWEASAAYDTCINDLKKLYE